MPKRPPIPEQLFDRPWRWGHPFVRRCGRVRRTAMTLLLLLFCGVIYTYTHVTDAARVRGMAQSYLSRLIGGRVLIGQATLSVFEGLRLDDVEVHADPAPDLELDADGNPITNTAAAVANAVPHGPPAPDTMLFSAKTFVIKYDVRAMLSGTLEATQIVIEKPRVSLTENVDTGAWNWHRLVRRGGGRRGGVRPTVSPTPPPKLPEILLRNARVEFNEIRGGKFSPVSYMAIDGQLSPNLTASDERYNFELQSRGVSEIGPSVKGWVSLGRGQVWAELMNFSFGPDVRSMLPDEVRRWWERHQLSGRIDIPVLSYMPAREGLPPAFRVETKIREGVSLSVRADEWLASNEARRLRRAREAVAAVREMYRAGGYALRTPAHLVPVRPGAVAPNSARDGTVEHLPAHVDRLAGGLSPPPLELENVAGKFVFTQDGVSIESLSGRVDGNGVRITGRIDGYSPDAPVTLKVASMEREDINIPASPRYLGSLPREVREFYEQLRPEGKCRLLVEVNRRNRGERPEVSGLLEIVNGRFLFSRFPYPLRGVTGRIVFGRDPATGQDRLDIQQIRGRGVEDGPNRNTFICVDGTLMPLGPNMGVNVRVTAEDVSSEEALRLAFPPDVRKAIAVFDPDGRGEYPKYRGKFLCDIVRPAGVRTRWTFDTDVTLYDGAGRLEAFPYPLENVTGILKIRTGRVDIINGRAMRGGGVLDVNGSVKWGETSGAPRGGTITDLRLSARDVPIDDELVKSLKGEPRQWLLNAGLSGKLDLDGRVFQGVEIAAPPSFMFGSPVVPAPVVRRPTPVEVEHEGEDEREKEPGLPVEYDLAVAVHGAAVQPFGGKFIVSDMAGILRLGRDTLEVVELKGRRGNAAITGKANVDFRGPKPSIRLGAAGQNLSLDGALYELLPKGARVAWDELQPAGAVDVEVAYDGTGEEIVSTAPRRKAKRPAARKPEPETAVVDSTSLLAPVDVVDLSAPPPASPVIPPGLKIVIKPRDLAVTLKSVPYKLDRLDGVVTVLPEKVVVENISGRHGDARIKVSGTGTTGPRGVWDLRLAGDDVPVDGDLLFALPPSLAGIIESLEVQGKVGFDFKRFVYRGSDEPATRPATAPARPTRTAATGPTGVATATATAGAAAMQPAEGGADIDMEGTVNLLGTALNVGVPLADVRGTFTLKQVIIREGRPVALVGDVSAPSMTVAGRPILDFRTDLLKPADRNELHFQKMQAKTAGGELGGGVTLYLPDEGPSSYSLNLALRNADVAKLANEPDAGVKGKLTASLSLEGGWGVGGASRQGSGVVDVQGRGMYQVPIVLGLMQVTNLALPVSGPFNEATAKYGVEGERIVFENIVLRSSNMLMSGDGFLDFGTKQVWMNFQTDNPKGLKLPFLDDLLQGARQELLKIKVRGTIEEPKVKAGMMGTFTTTIDEVMKGDPPPKPRKRK